MPDYDSNSVPEAWPFVEAVKVAERLHRKGKLSAVFETGYGPSGLPHIGTFAEVARTSWVRRAFAELTGLPSRLVAFSDDMDGLRKMPENVPNFERFEAEFVGVPLCRIPDPFGTHESFAAHNNAMLVSFLNSFGFEFEFMASSERYLSGAFDISLLRVLACHDAIVAAVAPSLRARGADYSPILPIHPVTGRVMQVAIDCIDLASGTVVWRDPLDGKRYETLVTGGACKMQWRADWAMRWHDLSVDYEMSGKDLIDSVKMSSLICRILGSEPPEGFTYELFLDVNGAKVSKSKGNGLTIDEWLRYAPPQGLAHFLYAKPKAAKVLSLTAVTRSTDDYLASVDRSTEQSANLAMSGSAWHVLDGDIVPARDGSPVSFAMLANLASVTDADTKETLWKFVSRHSPELTPESHPMVDTLIGNAIAWNEDIASPGRRKRVPTAIEAAALVDLSEVLSNMDVSSTGEAIQAEVYEVGKRHPFPTLRDWFRSIYQVLLGQDDGPRFGHFAEIYGIRETENMIRQAIAENSPEARGIA